MGMNDEVGGSCRYHPKATSTHSFVTASCNKRMKRVSTLIISSIKSFGKGVLHWTAIGRKSQKMAHPKWAFFF
jgi:hypothetical protein